MFTQTTQKISRALMVIGCPLIIAGCATHLSQQQCSSMNWYQVGFSDGAAGNFERNLNPAIQDCAKFHLTVNAEKYHRGWQAGAREFCQPARAEQLGVNGQTYNAICPENLSGAFEQAWRRGLRRYCTPSTGYNLGRQGAGYPDFCAPDQVVKFRNAYDDGRRIFGAIQGLDNDISELDRKIDNMRYRVRENRHKIDGINKQLQQGPLTPEQRMNLMMQQRDLNNSNLQLNDQMGRLESQKTRLQQQQRDYQTR